MRFCMVTTQEHWGGGEVLIASIARELTHVGHSVAWIVRDQSEVETHVEELGGHILHRPTKRGRNVRDFFAVRDVLNEWSPDVVIMNDTHAVMLAGLSSVLARHAKPVRLAYKHTIFPLRSKLKYRLLSDKVVCVSNAARDTIVRGGLPEQSAVVVYGGEKAPSQSEVENRPAVRERIRSELGMDSQQTLMLAVGNLLECKGHSDLVDAIAEVAKTRNVRLAIAGEGQERKKLEEQIARLEVGHRVSLLGYRSDTAQLMQAADLLVHPSHAEGLSLVLIQAQMLGVPIVATAVGGAAEVLQHNPQRNQPSRASAWIAAPANVGDLIKQITDALTVLGDPSKRAELDAALGETKRQTIAQFDIARNTQHLADLAATLLKE